MSVDRLFFFGAYQRTETTQQPASLLARVPTAQMLAGDFTTFAYSIPLDRSEGVRT